MTDFRAEGAAAGARIAVPSAHSIGHAGFVVPDLDEAIAFFTKVFGAALLWRTAPVSGEDADMLALFHAAPYRPQRF